jgi:molybdenum cofactor biosynthesis protein B
MDEEALNMSIRKFLKKVGITSQREIERAIDQANTEGRREFLPLNIAVLTVSDSRDEASDKSGALLVKYLTDAGHQLAEKAIVPDDKYRIREVVSRWIVDESVQVVLTTGGTGVTGRDGTPEAVTPLLDKVIDGFGETFRSLSYQTIGTSTLQSRAIAGVANGTYLFCLPGSSGACKDAWTQLISSQLDYRTRPCNLVELMPRLRET